MSIVQFYENVGYKGNGRMYTITDESTDVIILYENANDTISISSITNNTNYYVILYYKQGNKPFGGAYVNITSNLSNIYDLDTSMFRSSNIVVPFFNGVLLKKKYFFTIYQEKVILPNFNGTSPLDTNVAIDMRETYCLFTRNSFVVTCYDSETDQSNDIIQTIPETATEQSNDFEKTTEPTTLHNAPIENIDCETVPTYRQCQTTHKDLIQIIHATKTKNEECERALSNQYDSIHKKHTYEKTKLKKNIQDLNEQNKNLKNYGQNNRKVILFITFFDLLMFFYILYKRYIVRF